MASGASSEPTTPRLKGSHKIVNEIQGDWHSQFQSAGCGICFQYCRQRRVSPQWSAHESPPSSVSRHLGVTLRTRPTEPTALVRDVVRTTRYRRLPREAAKFDDIRRTQASPYLHRRWLRVDIQHRPYHSPGWKIWHRRRGPQCETIRQLARSLQHVSCRSVTLQLNSAWSPPG